MKRIGILRLSALGDVVLVVPLVNCLIKAYPDSEISWITTQSTVDLLGPIDRVRWVVVEKPKSLRAILSNRKILKKMEFDLVLVLQASFSAHLVSMYMTSQRKIGFDRRRGKDFHRFFVNESIPYENQHFVDAYLAFAKKIEIDVGEASWSGAFSNMDIEWANGILPKDTFCVGISTSPTKNERRWGMSGYKDIVRYLLSKDRFVCLVGGDGVEEIAFNEELESYFPRAIMNLTGKTNLYQWSAILRQIDLLVAPDTGCVHVARALETPVVGLYAVANPSLTGPYQEQDYCLNKYNDAIDRYLPNSKNKDYHLRVHHSDAMSLITADEVILKMESAFELLDK